MNAIELAETMDDSEPTHTLMGLASNMLRQQADKLKKYELRNQKQIKRIEELEKQLEIIMQANKDSRQ